MGGNKTPIIDELELYDQAKSWVEEYHQALVKGENLSEYQEVPKRLRRLTYQEAAILQSFPLDYDWQGSSSSIFKQIGNAVPCNLGYRVGQMVMDCLLQEEVDQLMIPLPHQLEFANRLRWFLKNENEYKNWVANSAHHHWDKQKKMTPEDFAKAFYQEKRSLVNLYLEPTHQTQVGELIKSLNLDEKGKERIRQIINGVLTDAFYTILLGIDGAAPIGKNQELYQLFDENGKKITGGEIESHAWEYFHNHKFEIENEKADFIAELACKSEGGRRTPAISGYRPQIKFKFDKMHTSGSQQFIDRKLVFPGDKVNAAIRIASVDYFANRLAEGMIFEFREGKHIIGNGRILKIVNKKLKKEAGRQ